MKLLKRLYLTNRFYIGLLSIAFVFIVAFVWPILMILAQGTLVLFFAITVLEILILFSHKKPVSASRRVPNPLSLGDNNTVHIKVQSLYKFDINAQLYDNAPVQLQLRDLHYDFDLKPNTSHTEGYRIRPTERGLYLFDDLFIYVATFLRLVQRKIVVSQKNEVAAYPSILQIKKLT